MRALRAPVSLLFIILSVIRPDIALSASLLPNDPIETCDPSPYAMEEGKMPDSGRSEFGLRKDLRLDSQPSSAVLTGPSRVPKPYGCKRAFLYRGKLRPIDSFNRQDGEKLRPIVSDVPDSIKDLDTYQHNRRKVQIGAYVGTLAILTAIATLFYAAQYPNPTQAKIRTVGLLGSLTLGIGSAVYSLAILRTNETYLRRAADGYNRVKPDDPIVLQFSTGILF